MEQGGGARGWARFDPVFRLKINQMGQCDLFGGGDQGWGQVVVHLCRDGSEGKRAVGEGIQNGSLTRVAVGCQVGQAAGHVGDDGAVAGIACLPVARGKGGEGGHVIGHGAFGRGDQAAGPAHHVIAGEQAVLPGKAQVAGMVARGVQRVDAAPWAGDSGRMGEGQVRAELAVDAVGPLCRVRRRGACIGAKGVDRGAGAGGKGGGEGGMVAVGVGHKDGRDAFTGCQCGEDGGKVAWVIGAGVDEGNGSLPDDPGIGAAFRHERGVGGQNAAQAGGDHIWLAGLTLHLPPFRRCVGPDRLPRMMRPKSFLPRSLYVRAALILIVPIVTIQLVVSIAFIQRHFDRVTEQMTHGVALELGAVVEARLTRGAQGAAELARGMQMRLDDPTGSAVTEDRLNWSDLTGGTVIATLHDEVAGLRAVDLAADPDEVRLLIDTGEGPLAIAVDRKRVSATNPHQLLVLMIFTSILMTVIAFIFLRNQLRPIKRLAVAADAFGKGRHVDYRPSGAVEVRAAGSAFLDMRARIERQIEQRTLMLSGVSHDLRTPLTRMRLGLSLLSDEEEGRALLEDVAVMERLVDEFLAFARGDAMEEPQDADVQVLVRRLVDDAQRSGSDVTLGAVDGPAMVRLRPAAVTRAVENLLGNAVRYGKQAVVSMAVTERAVRITVEDAGPGIPKERRDEAMMPFARLDQARDPNKGGGVGLGLSIAADIARSHGGVLRLGESEALGGLKAELILAR